MKARYVLASLFVTTATALGVETAAVAAPPGPAPSPAPWITPAPAPTGGIGIQSTRDGVWEEGEFALWKNTGFGNPIYDTSNDSLSTYNGRYFVNTNQRLNDEASSTANGFRDRAMRAHQHSNWDGPSLYHTRYPTCPSTCYAYSPLGWANDELSSHVRAS